MPRLLTAVILSAILLTSCSNRQEKDFDDYLAKNERCIYALALPVGDSILIPASAQGCHPSHPVQFRGMKTVFADYDKLLLTNAWITLSDTAVVSPLACMGCDTCFSMYASAGLIEYSRDGDYFNVRLTDKGRDNLVENYIHADTLVHALREHGCAPIDHVELVLLGKDIFETEIIKPDNQQGAENIEEYLGRVVRRVEPSPFLEALGGTGRNDSLDWYAEYGIFYYPGQEKPVIRLYTRKFLNEL